MNDREERINTIIANNLDDLLKNSNRTQLELAEHLGVTQATISNWCNGIKMPRMDKIDLICEYFGIRRSQLMSKKEDSSSSAPIADPNEDQLIAMYRELNSAGQKKLREYAEDLLGSDKYKKDSIESVVAG